MVRSDTMGGFLVIVLILVGVIGLYILSYWLNSNTKAPIETDPLIGCGSCALNGSCSLKEYSKDQCEDIHKDFEHTT